jgi:hypothetical protein
MTLRTCLFGVGIAIALAPASSADLLEPGSVLIYTMNRSGAHFFTVLSVTNTNTLPANQISLGGTTNVMFEYLNTIPNPADPQLPLGCYVTDRVETLTPADTLSVLTTCHNAATAEGYVVVSAQDPSLFKSPWSWNYLIGSELVINALGGTYLISAIPFEAECEEKSDTDKDRDYELDFDGQEYEGIPETLYIPNFLAAVGSSLTLINLTGGTEHVASIRFDIWNDNEFPLSATKQFRCWFEEPLTNVSPTFSEFFLKNNTPNDPQELDVNCDNVGDLETGWAAINGLFAFSTDESIQDPALLGAITAGPISLPLINGGDLLWGSDEEQYNGDFIHQSVNNPEY